LLLRVRTGDFDNLAWPTFDTLTWPTNASPPRRAATVSGNGIDTHWTRTTLDGFGRTIKTETGSGALTNAAASVVDTV